MREGGILNRLTFFYEKILIKGICPLVLDVVVLVRARIFYLILFIENKQKLVQPKKLNRI